MSGSRWCRRKQLEVRPTFFSMEQRPNLQPNLLARLTMRASIHSDLPELGTPVMIVSSPGTTCTPSTPLHQQLGCGHPPPVNLCEYKISMDQDGLFRLTQVT